MVLGVTGGIVGQGAQGNADGNWVTEVTEVTEVTDRDRQPATALTVDVPAHIQYVRWMSGILLRGTLGQSLQRGHKPVEGKILARIPVTLELGQRR